MTFKPLFFALLAGLLCFSAGMNPARAASVWIEGEDAAGSQVTPHGWYNSVRAEVLSGGKWLSHFDDKREGAAGYKVTLPRDGRYVFWVRANPVAAKLSYRLDGGEWALIALDQNQRGQLNIAADAKPDLRFITWCRVTALDLKAGEHALDFKMHSGPQNHGGIDCFVFTDDGFVPSGTLKPGSAAPAAPGDWFPVVADDDAFSKDSVIDLSRLVEMPAGKYGFLKRDGASLKFENAKNPVKFWGVNAHYDGRAPESEQIQHLRYLKKYGVNMIRLHTVSDAVGPMQNDKFDAARLDAFDRWFARVKEHGLYVTASMFYPLKISAQDGYDPALFAELEDAGNGLKSTYGLVNIERKLQDMQMNYCRAFLQHVNPYTKKRYLDEPALAVFEFHNEDTVFFHNPLGGLADPKKWPLHSRRLRKKWGEWVKAKYTSEETLKTAWGKLMPGDNWQAGEMRLMGAFHLGGDGPMYEFGGQKQRAGDFVRFLTELQNAYYTRREKELRDLGFKAVTVTTAWRAGGAAADPANLFCDTAADMIDRHNYAGGGAGGHAIAGGEVNDESHLDIPGSGLLATGLYQVEDRPFCITEWSSMPPNNWKFEAAPLIAFYGLGLQGWDASYHFANGMHRIGDGWPGLGKYVTDTPHYIGQFPALAFALHHGHMTEATIASARRIGEEDLYQGVDPLQQDFTGGGHDNKTLKGEPATPAQVLAIGRVTVAFDGKVSEAVDWTKYWDKSAKIIRSMTGELIWDYGHGRVQVQTLKTQAFIGRAGSDRIDLPAVQMNLRTPFVSVIFTPLDNLELAKSKNILITALARDKQTGTQYSEDGKKLIAVGGPPLLMEPVQATLKIQGTRPKKVRALDIYGVPLEGDIEIKPDGSFDINGRYRAYYYQVER